MHFHVLTLFPEMIEQGMNTSIMGRAIERGYISLKATDIRDYAANKHNKVDDTPYGGGAGMVMQAAPVYGAYEAVKEQIGYRPRGIYLTPQGSTFSQPMAEEFAREQDLVFLCGHYEGIDERVLEEIVTDYVSIGDYVLTGGELPAMVMMDAISRLVPGVLHNEASAEFESFQGNLLEHPHYSRPEVWHEKRVPEVLLSGHHANIEKWRREQSVIRTAERRPECLDVFYEEAHKHHSYVIEIRKPKRVYYGASISYDYHGYHISLSTSAHYQVTNSALAINILEYIRKEFPFKDADLEKGMHDAVWEGRFETIHQNPLIILDGAHNREGMDAFFESARDFSDIKIIFSALGDKDTHHMLETLLSLSKDITVTQFDHPRRATAKALAEDFPVKVDEDWKHAVDEAYSHKGVVFITGSLYFISKVRQYILSKK